MSLAAEKLFYSLAGFVLLTALFVFQPSTHQPVAEFQTLISSQLSVAWQQTIGDQPVWNEVSLIFDSANEFYTQAATATIALFEHGSTDHDLAMIGRGVYLDFSKALARVAQSGDRTLAQAPPNPKFMTEQPIYNIIPQTASVNFTPMVLGASIEPVNAQTPWVTMRDNFTGQLYCLAIYNNEVNKYLGPCKYDYH